MQAKDAPVFAAVKIQPLEVRDVERSLKKLIADNDIPSKKLRKNLTTNKPLRESINSAFFVHTLLNLYSENKTTHISYNIYSY